MSPDLYLKAPSDAIGLMLYASSLLLGISLGYTAMHKLLLSLYRRLAARCGGVFSSLRSLPSFLVIGTQIAGPAFPMRASSTVGPWKKPGGARS